MTLLIRFILVSIIIYLLIRSFARYFEEQSSSYDPRASTCAHKKHAFGTLLKVTLLDGSSSVVCRVNDRGPFVRGRVVDLSRALAAKLGITERGVARVTVQKVR